MLYPLTIIFNCIASLNAYKQLLVPFRHYGMNYFSQTFGDLDILGLDILGTIQKIYMIFSTELTRFSMKDRYSSLTN